jgi:hypothetical protein
MAEVIGKADAHDAAADDDDAGVAGKIGHVRPLFMVANVSFDRLRHRYTIVNHEWHKCII